MRSKNLPKLMVFPIAITLLFFIIAASALTNGGETSSSYVSVRALDSYGNAVQLSHAKEAAQRYGRSVIVAVVEGVREPGLNTTDKILSEIPTEEEKSSYLMVVSLGKSPIFHPIQLPLEKQPSSMLGICFTGVKGDANWLLQQIRKHAADVWERYDTSMMSAPAVAHVVARLLGRFARQAEDKEWQSSLGLPGKHDGDDDQQSSWSRPLGVQTMILSTSKQAGKQPGLLIVEPSGRVLNPVARSKSGLVSLAAMGKESDKVESHLLRLLRGDFPDRKGNSDENQSSLSWEDRPPSYETCRDSLLRVLIEEATNSRSGRHDPGGDILVESFSSDGGQIERRMFRYENGKTYVSGQ